MITPPTLPNLPEDWNGAPLGLLDLEDIPVDNTVNIPDGDSNAFWQAVESSPGGTAVVLPPGDYPFSTCRWTTKKARQGWVVVRPTDSALQAIKNVIGSQGRIRESLAPMMPRIHAFPGAQEGYLIGHPNADDPTIVHQRSEDRNLFLSHINLNLDMQGQVGRNIGFAMNGDGIYCDRVLFGRFQATTDMRAPLVVTQGYDQVYYGCTMTDAAQPLGSEQQAVLCQPRTTRILIDNSHIDFSGESLFINGHDRISGKTSQDITIRRSLIGDWVGKYIGHPRWNYSKALVEWKTGDRVLFEMNVIGKQRSNPGDGGQTARFTVYRAFNNAGKDAVGRDWTIRRNMFHTSPNEFQLMLLIAFLSNGKKPDGLHRISITDNAFFDIAPGHTKRSPLEVFFAQWLKHDPDNDTGDVEIARNVWHYPSAKPFGAMHAIGDGGGLLAANPLPGPLEVYDNIMDAGGGNCLRSSDMATSKLGDALLDTILEDHDWHHNAHVRASDNNSFTSSKTVVSMPVDVKFVDPDRFDFTLQSGSPLIGKGSDGGEPGIQHPATFKTDVDHAIAGTVDDTPILPPPPPPSDLEDRVKALEAVVLKIGMDWIDLKDTTAALARKIIKIEDWIEGFRKE